MSVSSAGPDGYHRDQIKIPSRPAPKPPQSSHRLPNDSDANDSQHSSSPTDYNSAARLHSPNNLDDSLMFKVVPPTPDDGTDMYQPNFSREDAIRPPNKPPPPPPDQAARFSPPVFIGGNGRLTSTSSSASHHPESTSRVGDISQPHPEGTATRNCPRSGRLSSSESQQRGISPAKEITQNPALKQVALDSSADFGALVSPSRRLRSQENLMMDRARMANSGFLTMQRPGVGTLTATGYTMGQVRAATIARANHPESLSSGLFSTIQRGQGGVFPGGPPMYGNAPFVTTHFGGVGGNLDEVDECESIYNYGGKWMIPPVYLKSSRHISVAYCTIMAIVAINLYMCQFYPSSTLEVIRAQSNASALHIFAILVYILGIILVILLITLFQFAKVDPRATWSKDQRHCSVYLRTLLVVFCLLTSLHFIVNTAYCVSRIMDACFEKYLPRVFHFAFVVIFCYLELYLIIVYSKLLVSVQRMLVAFSVAHLCFLNIFLLFSTLMLQLESKVDVSEFFKPQVFSGFSTSGRSITFNNSTTTLSTTTTAGSVDNQQFASQFGHSASASCEGNASTVEGSASSIIVGFTTAWCNYLYCFSVQFALLALSYLFTLWANVKSQRKRTLQRRPAGGAGGLSWKTYNMSERAKYFNCHHTSLGFLASLGVIAVAITFVFLFSAAASAGGEEGSANEANILIITFHSFIIVLMVTMLGLFFKCIVEFQHFVAKSDSYYHNVLDRPFLLICVCAVFIYYAMCIIACFARFLSLKSDLTYTVLPTLSYTLILLQALLQVIFLSDGLKRHATRKNRSRSRNLIVILLGCNLALFVLTLYKLNSDSGGNMMSDRIEISFYGYKWWSVVNTILAPFVIFFYLHSSACFFDIWQFSFL